MVPLRGIMGPFKTLTQEEIAKINKSQKELFDRLYRLFEPPLPEGVPERLEEIVRAGGILPGDTVLDIGSGTGILIPIIKRYKPSQIYACDLSEKMLSQLKTNYPDVQTFLTDVKDLRLPQASVDVAFLNACYPNIADKAGAFHNLSRIVKPGGRVVISHPIGKTFILSLKDAMSFPLDEFPGRQSAEELFKPYGFEVASFTDQAQLYILVLKKAASGL
ncbi:MAG TPA: class I SAM-dependent methyltransferase [Desulfobacterales bacterium]|nr:class I SAM-dependent methyltransferase [Desulfobacterales bacterium]